MQYKKTVTDKVELKQRIVVDVPYSDSPNKVGIQVVVKDETYRKTGKEQEATRLFDHKNDMYNEKIVDKESAQTIREVGEPLSEHKGHGSAKRKVNWSRFRLLTIVNGL